MLPFNKKWRELYQGMLFGLGMEWVGFIGSRNWSEKAGARGSVDGAAVVGCKEVGWRWDLE